MLPDYIRHMKSNPDTLLCRFFALIRVKPRTRYFLVMGNILDSARDIHEVRARICAFTRKEAAHICAMSSIRDSSADVHEVCVYACAHLHPSGECLPSISVNSDRKSMAKAG